MQQALGLAAAATPTAAAATTRLQATSSCCSSWDGAQGHMPAVAAVAAVGVLQLQEQWCHKGHLQGGLLAEEKTKDVDGKVGVVLSAIQCMKRKEHISINEHFCCNFGDVFCMAECIAAVVGQLLGDACKQKAFCSLVPVIG